MRSFVEEVKYNLPLSLINSQFMLPMPMYDNEGVFKSYLPTRNNFSQTKPRANETFDYSKLIKTSIHDSVFEEFVEKAKQMEMAAGKPLLVQQLKKQVRTNREAIEEFSKNPLRYYTVTDFQKSIRNLKGQKSQDLPPIKQRQPIVSERKMPEVTSLIANQKPILAAQKPTVTLRKEKSVSLISDTSRNNRFNKRTQSQHSLRVNRETMNEPLRKIVEALKIRPRRRPKPKPEITTPYLQKLTIPQAIKKYDSQQSQMSRASDTFRSELVLNQVKKNVKQLKDTIWKQRHKSDAHLKRNKPKTCKSATGQDPIAATKQGTITILDQASSPQSAADNSPKSNVSQKQENLNSDRTPTLPDVTQVSTQQKQSQNITPSVSAFVPVVNKPDDSFRRPFFLDNPLFEQKKQEFRARLEGALPSFRADSEERFMSSAFLQL